MKLKQLKSHWEAIKGKNTELSLLEYSPTWEIQNGYQVPVWTFPIGNVGGIDVHVDSTD